MVLCDLPCAQAYYRYMAPPNTSKQHTHAHKKHMGAPPQTPANSTHRKYTSELQKQEANLSAPATATRESEVTHGSLPKGVASKGPKHCHWGCSTYSSLKEKSLRNQTSSKNKAKSKNHIYVCVCQN